MADLLQFVSFYLEDRLYGLDIRIVKEINPNLQISPVPRTPRHIRGLVNIRGQVVLVMDFAVMLGRTPRPVSDDSKIVILKTAAEIRNLRGAGTPLEGVLFGSKPVGLLVDRIGDVVTVAADDLEPAPQHLDEHKARYFTGVVRQDDELQMILDAGVMLSLVG